VPQELLKGGLDQLSCAPSNAVIHASEENLQGCLCALRARLYGSLASRQACLDLLEHFAHGALAPSGDSFQLRGSLGALSLQSCLKGAQAQEPGLSALRRTLRRTLHGRAAVGSPEARRAAPRHYRWGGSRGKLPADLREALLHAKQALLEPSRFEPLPPLPIYPSSLSLWILGPGQSRGRLYACGFRITRAFDFSTWILRVCLLHCT
jgi:hypothetical protein